MTARLYTARPVRVFGANVQAWKGLVAWKWVLVQSGVETSFGSCLDCDGHFTEQEARQHWRAYVANRLTTYRQSRQYAELPCARCLHYTKLYATVDLYGLMADLCENCQTPASIEQLLGTPADVMVEVEESTTA